MTSKPADIEEGLAFTLNFDANGLVTAVVTDAKSGDVLMVAHMNEEAIRKTVASGEACVSCGGELAVRKTIEVGHIFKLGTR